METAHNYRRRELNSRTTAERMSTVGGQVTESISSGEGTDILEAFDTESDIFV